MHIGESSTEVAAVRIEKSVGIFANLILIPVSPWSGMGPMQHTVLFLAVLGLASAGTRACAPRAACCRAPMRSLGGPRCALESWNGRTRYNFDAVVPKRDLPNHYLSAFKSCVPMCVNGRYLQDTAGHVAVTSIEQKVTILTYLQIH